MDLYDDILLILRNSTHNTSNNTRGGPRCCRVATAPVCNATNNMSNTSCNGSFADNLNTSNSTNSSKGNGESCLGWMDARRLNASSVWREFGIGSSTKFSTNETCNVSANLSANATCTPPVLCEWGVGRVCPDVDHSPVQGHTEPVVADQDGGVYLAGIFTGSHTGTSTTLNGQLTTVNQTNFLPSNTSVRVSSADGLTVNMYIQIDAEILSITSVSGKDLGVSRGALGTSQAHHAQDAAVYAVTTVASTVLRVSDASGLAVGVYLRISSEVMRITSIAAEQLVVERGLLGTKPQLHQHGSVVARLSSGISTLRLECARPGHGGNNWTEVLALRNLTGGPHIHGGFVLRMRAAGNSSWLRGPLPAMTAGRAMVNVRLVPWLSTRSSTIAAHGLSGGYGGQVFSGLRHEDASHRFGVYFVSHLTPNEQGIRADLVRAHVERYNSTLEVNLSRVNADALLVGLLSGAGGELAWLRTVSGERPLGLSLAKPTSGASVFRDEQGADSLLYLPASWHGGGLTVQSCAFDLRPAATTTPSPTPPPALAAPDKELAMPPHLQCYRGAPRGYAFVVPFDMILTGLRWAPLETACSAEHATPTYRPELSFTVALMDQDTPLPGAGVSWRKARSQYSILANYSGVPPHHVPRVETREFPDDPNGGGGGWVVFEKHVPQGRTVAVWGQMDGYVSYAGSASHPVNGITAAQHEPHFVDFAALSAYIAGNGIGSGYSDTTLELAAALPNLDVGEYIKTCHGEYMKVTGLQMAGTRLTVTRNAAPPGLLQGQIAAAAAGTAVSLAEVPFVDWPTQHALIAFQDVPAQTALIAFEDVPTQWSLVACEDKMHHSAIIAFQDTSESALINGSISAAINDRTVKLTSALPNLSVGKYIKTTANEYLMVMSIDDSGTMLTVARDGAPPGLVQKGSRAAASGVVILVAGGLTAAANHTTLHLASAIPSLDVGDYVKTEEHEYLKVLTRSHDQKTLVVTRDAAPPGLTQKGSRATAPAGTAVTLAQGGLDDQLTSQSLKLITPIANLELGDYVKSASSEYMKVVSKSVDGTNLTLQRNGSPVGLIQGSLQAVPAGSFVTLAKGGISEAAGQTSLKLASPIGQLDVNDYIKSAADEYMKVISIAFEDVATQAAVIATGIDDQANSIHLVLATTIADLQVGEYLKSEANEYMQVTGLSGDRLTVTVSRDGAPPGLTQKGSRAAAAAGETVMLAEMGGLRLTVERDGAPPGLVRKGSRAAAAAGSTVILVDGGLDDQASVIAFQDHLESASIAVHLDNEATSTTVVLASAMPNLDVGEYIKQENSEYMKVTAVANAGKTLTVERGGNPPGLVAGSVAPVPGGSSVVLAEGGVDDQASSTSVRLVAAIANLEVGEYIKSAANEYMKVTGIADGGKMLTVARNAAPAGLTQGSLSVALAGTSVTLVEAAFADHTIHNSTIATGGGVDDQNTSTRVKLDATIPDLEVGDYIKSSANEYMQITGTSDAGKILTLVRNAAPPGLTQGSLAAAADGETVTLATGAFAPVASQYALVAFEHTNVTAVIGTGVDNQASSQTLQLTIGLGSLDVNDFVKSADDEYMKVTDIAFEDVGTETSEIAAGGSIDSTGDDTSLVLVSEIANLEVGEYLKTEANEYLKVKDMSADKKTLAVSRDAAPPGLTQLESMAAAAAGESVILVEGRTLTVDRNAAPAGLQQGSLANAPAGSLLTLVEGGLTDQLTSTRLKIDAAITNLDVGEYLKSSDGEYLKVSEMADGGKSLTVVRNAFPGGLTRGPLSAVAAGSAVLLVERAFVEVPSQTALIAFEDVAAQTANISAGSGLDAQASSQTVILDSAIEDLDVGEYIKRAHFEYMKVTAIASDGVTLTVERNGAPDGLSAGSIGAYPAGSIVTLTQLCCYATVKLASAIPMLDEGEYIKTTAAEYLKVIAMTAGGTTLTVTRNAVPPGLVQGSVTAVAAGTQVLLAQSPQVNLTLWRLVADSMTDDAGVSLEQGPSIARWRLSYRISSISSSPSPDPGPPPVAGAPSASAAELMLRDGVLCEHIVRPQDTSSPACDDAPSLSRQALDKHGRCRLATPVGTSSALLLAFSGTGEVQWVRTATGGDMRLVAASHSQQAIMSASTSVVGRGWDLGHLEHVLRLAAYQDAVVLVGQVRGAALADWGRTLWPLSCSHGRSVGAKGLSGVSAASACSGQVRAQGSSGQADLVVVRVRALDGLVVWVRRTGLKDREEAVASVALDAKADVYVLGSFASQAAGLAQGQEDGAAGGSGSDVFSLVEARRGRAVGCDADRRYGSKGLPLCSMRSHSPLDDGSLGPTTAFLVAYLSALVVADCSRTSLLPCSHLACRVCVCVCVCTMCR